MHNRLYKLFTKLRVQAEHSDHQLPNRTKIIVEMARTIPSFLTGAIIYHGRSHGSPLIEHNGSPLFFGKNVTKEYKSKSKKTLKLLEEKQLFISTIIHEHLPMRAKNIDLWYTARATLHIPSTLGSAISIQRLSKLPKLIMSELESIIPEPDRRHEIGVKATKYSTAIRGYFRGPNRISLVTYCPFLVSDENPPGNFFGVFDYKNTVNFSALVKHLTWVQMAGTLVFSQATIRDLLNFEKRKKFVSIRQKVNDLQEVRLSMQRAIEALEREVSPFRFATGVTVIETWILTILQRKFGGQLHDAGNWSKSDLALLASDSCIIFKKLTDEVGEEQFLALFGAIRTPPGDNVTKGAFIAKSIMKNRIPLCWLDDNIAADFALEPIYKASASNQMQLALPPLTFALAVRAIHDHSSVNMKTRFSIQDSYEDGDKNCMVTIEVEVQIDERIGPTGLPILARLICEKRNQIRGDGSTFTGDLSSGHTSNCLAVILSACSEVDQFTIIDGTYLALTGRMKGLKII